MWKGKYFAYSEILLYIKHSAEYLNIKNLIEISRGGYVLSTQKIVSSAFFKHAKLPSNVYLVWILSLICEIIPLIFLSGMTTTYSLFRVGLYIGGFPSMIDISLECNELNFGEGFFEIFNRVSFAKCPVNA